MSNSPGFDFCYFDYDCKKNKAFFLLVERPLAFGTGREDRCAEDADRGEA